MVRPSNLARRYCGVCSMARKSTATPTPGLIVSEYIPAEFRECPELYQPEKVTSISELVKAVEN